MKYKVNSLYTTNKSMFLFLIDEIDLTIKDEKLYYGFTSIDTNFVPGGKFEISSSYFKCPIIRLEAGQNFMLLQYKELVSNKQIIVAKILTDSKIGWMSFGKNYNPIKELIAE